MRKMTVSIEIEIKDDEIDGIEEWQIKQDLDICLERLEFSTVKNMKVETTRMTESELKNLKPNQAVQINCGDEVDPYWIDCKVHGIPYEDIKDGLIIDIIKNDGLVLCHNLPHIVRLPFGV